MHRGYREQQRRAAVQSRADDGTRSDAKAKSVLCANRPSRLSANASIPLAHPPMSHCPRGRRKRSPARSSRTRRGGSWCSSSLHLALENSRQGRRPCRAGARRGLTAGGRFEVERDRLLAMVDRHEIGGFAVLEGAVMARVIAARAGLGEQQSAVRAREDAGEIDDMMPESGPR